MSAIDHLLGIESDPPRCKVFAPDVSVHWFAPGAKPGDTCLCGQAMKQDHEDEAEGGDDD